MNNYTSLQLSKKLAKCGLESEYWWYSVKEGETYKGVIVTSESAYWISLPTHNLPAYDILNDICVKYAKEFFGEEETCGKCEAWGVCTKEHKMGWQYHTQQILSLLQQGKNPEDYIWENCRFNPKNK